MNDNTEFPRRIIKKISDYKFEIPIHGDMRVPAYIFVSEAMLNRVDDKALFQISNVATLPGIVKAAMVMPDVHCGYGFPIGGVAAFDIDNGGIITPGGIGYDINCGVRLMTVDIPFSDFIKKREEIVKELSSLIPSGVNKGGEFIARGADMVRILESGARGMHELVNGVSGDYFNCESEGQLPGADHRAISFDAKKRGANQLGTLGAGNHFLEIQRVEDIYDDEIAKEYGLKKDMVTVMIHCGSRGLGHQTCKDYIKLMGLREEIKNLPDKELVYAPFLSDDGQLYFSAMNAAANFAFANRYLIGYNVRKAFRKVFGLDTYVETVYDLSHNIGKVEVHNDKKCIVHRKGATRAFVNRVGEIGKNDKPHPVLVPGSMGTASYVLSGTEKGMKETFGSVCHGAGRAMSRSAARKTIDSKEVKKAMQEKDIYTTSNHAHNLSEESPQAYKDIDNVIESVVGNGIAKKVAKLVPIAVIKG